VTALVERHGALPAPRTARFCALVVVPDPVLRADVVRQVASLGAAEIAEASTVSEARARARLVPGRDLCIVDASLPDGSGIGLITELRTAGWARGMVLSSSEDPYTVRAALAAGVRSFLVTSPQRRVPGQRNGHDSDVLVARTRRGANGPEGLSAREVEVLRLVSEGRSNRDIGTELGLSALTVKSHLARIARKLGTGDRAEMVVLALRAGLIA